MSAHRADTCSRSDDYARELTSAWSAHLAPKPDGAPTFVSLFAGCGGSSLGYSMAGFRELAAVECDADPCASLRANFPALDVREEDITTMDLSTLPVPDVLDGSPPCQGFSEAGKRRVNDHRNRLFESFVRALEVLRPRAFVMENVAGMVKGRMRLVFVEILKALRGAGYRVSARMLDAQYFGVPQQRRRMIFVGVRADLRGVPTHPEASSMPPTLADACPWVTRVDVPGHGYMRGFAIRPGEAITTLTSSGLSGFTYEVERETELTGEVRRIWETGARRTKGKYYNFVRADPDRPLPTLAAMWGASGSLAQVTHPTEPRRFSILECKLLCSFPPWFEVVGDYASQFRQVGNCVPPLFMRAIASHLREKVFHA